MVRYSLSPHRDTYNLLGGVWGGGLVSQHRYRAGAAYLKDIAFPRGSRRISLESGLNQIRTAFVLSKTSGIV
jgi:hypothetical protein